jgi:hypothetical protein
MSRVLLVHGIAQQYRGAESLRAAYTPALRDGVSFAGGSLAADAVSVAFYGDLFRPPGSRSPALPDYDASDVDDPLELALLDAWWREAARLDPSVPNPSIPDRSDATRGRTPNWAQRALYALCGSAYFAGVAERALIGALKQVRAYLTDRDTRVRVQSRVQNAITAQTTVLIGHSLGSVIGYEVLCGTPDLPVTTFVTLGSPLGVPKLVFDRLRPPPIAGKGAWPRSIRDWTNIADSGDVVALTKTLAPHFGNQVSDLLVHNGVKAHDVRPYLTARETGDAILAGLAPSV